MKKANNIVNNKYYTYLEAYLSIPERKWTEYPKYEPSCWDGSLITIWYLGDKLNEFTELLMIIMNTIHETGIIIMISFKNANLFKTKKIIMLSKNWICNNYIVIIHFYRGWVLFVLSIYRK